jgi:hypothetical protein
VRRGVGGAAGPVTEVQRLVDRVAVVDTIVGIANAFDRKDWTRLRGYLAPELEVDYSDFRGEPSSRVSADAYVAGRASGLHDLATLHISTNHEVQLDGDLATCRSAYRIYRVDRSLAPEAGRLDTAGHYEHRLARAGGRWLVTAITQTVVMQRGNRAVHRGLGPGSSTDPGIATSRGASEPSHPVTREG